MILEGPEVHFGGTLDSFVGLGGSWEALGRPDLIFDGFSLIFGVPGGSILDQFWMIFRCWFLIYFSNASWKRFSWIWGRFLVARGKVLEAVFDVFSHL